MQRLLTWAQGIQAPSAALVDLVLRALPEILVFYLVSWFNQSFMALEELTHHDYEEDRHSHGYRVGGIKVAVPANILYTVLSQRCRRRTDWKK